MDKFSRLLSESQFTRYIFGNSRTTDYVLTDRPMSDDAHAQRVAIERGLTFVGVMGMVHGLPQTALAVDLDTATRKAITRTFVAQVMEDPAAVDQFATLLVAVLSALQTTGKVH